MFKISFSIRESLLYEDAKMNKLDWLMKLRHCQDIETLEKIIEYHKYNDTPASRDEAFNSAVDHRLAELTVGKNFDKIPASVWSLVK